MLEKRPTLLRNFKRATPRQRELEQIKIYRIQTGTILKEFLGRAKLSAVQL